MRVGHVIPAVRPTVATDAPLVPAGEGSLTADGRGASQDAGPSAVAAEGFLRATPIVREGPPLKDGEVILVVGLGPPGSAPTVPNGAGPVEAVRPVVRRDEAGAIADARPEVPIPFPSPPEVIPRAVAGPHASPVRARASADEVGPTVVGQAPVAVVTAPSHVPLPPAPIPEEGLPRRNEALPTPRVRTAVGHRAARGTIDDVGAILAIHVALAGLLGLIH